MFLLIALKFVVRPYCERLFYFTCFSKKKKFFATDTPSSLSSSSPERYVTTVVSRNCFRVCRQVQTVVTVAAAEVAEAAAAVVTAI